MMNNFRQLWQINISIPSLAQNISMTIPRRKNTNTAQHYWRGRSCWEDIFVWFNYLGGLSVARREVRHGVQFDLDHNGIIDDSYYANYQPDTFGEWSSHENPMIKYPVGNFLNIYLSGNPDE
jgi:hypothetical protein